MNKKHLLFFLSALLFFSLSVFIVFADAIWAQDTTADMAVEEIQYPISELGNCKDKNNCKKYCDKQENIDACITFAEKKNLMPKEEIETAKKFIAAGSKGPGGCKNKNECEAYCDNIDNINECVTFAEQNNILPPRELEEVKKVKAAIDKGVKPPACKSKKECDSYCSSPDNMEECLAFAEAASFMPPEELANAKKVLAAVKQGIKPPACKGKEECDTYCSDERNFEECINFAEAAGFMRPEEVEMAKKTKGKGPGGCRGKEECESFCQKEENTEVCAQFALEHGLMKPEEVEIMRKTGGKGPGGCRGKDECEAFCSNPDNQETCFNFAKDNNLIPPEEAEKMQEGRMKMQEHIRSAPPEISECLKSTVGEEVLNKLQSGTFISPRELGDQMRSCFEKLAPPGGEMGPPEGMMQPEGQEGIMLREGVMPPQFQKPEFKGGPGNCQSPEECAVYCADSTHKEECSSFAPQQMQQIRLDDERMMPPKNMIPREGMRMPPNDINLPEGVMPQEYEDYQRQPQEKFKEQTQMIPEGMRPPEGFIPQDYRPEGAPPPESYLKPPEGFVPPDGTSTYQQPQQYQYQNQQQYPIQQYEQIMPLPQMETQPAPETYQAPSSSLLRSPLAQIAGFLLRLMSIN